MGEGPLWLVVLLSVLASAFKVVGGVVFGSRALFVDALTSIANVIAVLGTAYYYRLSLRPPDEDHHYGHYRLGFVGVLVTLATYSFVAGLAVRGLVEFKEYEVSIYAPLMALGGFILYLAAIVVSRRVSEFFVPYAFFTASELMESCVVIASSLAGALYSFLIDYAGAVLITAYIFFEIYKTINEIGESLSDAAPPPAIVAAVKRELESAGFKVRRIRLRLLSKGQYQGDITVAVSPDMRIDEMHEMVDRVERRLRERYGVDVVVHVEPEEG